MLSRSRLDETGTRRRCACDPGRGPEREGRDMFRRGTQQQVRIRDFALVMGLLLVRQPGKRRAVRGAAQREGPGAVAMGNAVVPIETCTAALAEGWHERAQLRVHVPAVITLVVVLHDHFPVGAHVVDALRATTQIAGAHSVPACARAPRAVRAATGSAWLKGSRI